MKRFKITQYKTLEKVNFYSVHFEGDEYNETDKFIKRFINDPKYQENFQTIIYWISKIGSLGALERYFRPEGKAKAIPIDTSKLRLYCIRVSDEILILGNGGIKSSNSVKDSPDCYPHFQCMNNVKFLLDQSRVKGDTSIEGYQLKGKLNFYLKE